MSTLHLPIVLSICLSLLSGCGPLLIRDDARGAYVPIQLGTFELHKEVIVRGGHTRTYLQGGRVVSGVNEFLPHCQLEVNTLKETPRTVLPDTFTLTRVSTRTDQVVQTAPPQLATLDDFTLTHVYDFDNGESRRMYVYLFFMHSDRQPDVRALICGGAFDSPWLAQRPSLDEIAESLGGYGTLILR